MPPANSVPPTVPRAREGDERRNHPRVTADWPITITLDDGEHEARIRDVSRSGVCFYLDRRIPEMTVLRMELDVPAAERGGPSLVGSGVVVRCQPISELVDHYEIAVFLHDMDERDRDRLESYVAARAG
ncbi:MAG: PilZ domain-containing protein [Planctomycetota bacterium]|nr:PilZ domain-containing protein [Planctomycetota bacterium]